MYSFVFDFLGNLDPCLERICANAILHSFGGVVEMFDCDANEKKGEYCPQWWEIVLLMVRGDFFIFGKFCIWLWPWSLAIDIVIMLVFC